MLHLWFWCVVEGDVLGHKNRALVAFQKGSGVGLVLWVSPGCLERFGYTEDRLLLLRGAAFLQHWGCCWKWCLQHSGVFTWCHPRKGFCIASTDVCCTQGSHHCLTQFPPHPLCTLPPISHNKSFFLENKPLLLFALCSSVTSEPLQALLPSVLARL